MPPNKEVYSSMLVSPKPTFRRGVLGLVSVSNMGISGIEYCNPIFVFPWPSYIPFVHMGGGRARGLVWVTAASMESGSKSLSASPTGWMARFCRAVYVPECHLGKSTL